MSVHEPSDRHFDIPDKFQEFLRYDSGKDDNERILVFGDPHMTSVLESSKFWLGDRTFKLSPKNFYQIYTLHVYILGIAPACLYALLPNKTEKTYSRLLDALDTFAPDCKPDKVLLDFEIAPINAFQKHHPTSILSGCYFHLTQNFVRKIGELGLKKLVSENHEVALALKMIPALAFERSEQIEKSFELIVEEITNVADQQSLDSFVIEKIDELCLYFQTNYIKCPLLNRPATFPPQIWNQRDAAIEGIARTTNAVEGWHYGIQALFSGSHPGIWKLLTNLQKDAAVQKLNFLNASSGHKFPKKKKYENLKGKVQNLMQIYRDETDIHFFRAIASLT